MNNVYTKTHQCYLNIMTLCSYWRHIRDFSTLKYWVTFFVCCEWDQDSGCYSHEISKSLVSRGFANWQLTKFWCTYLTVITGVTPNHTLRLILANQFLSMAKIWKRDKARHRSAPANAGDKCRVLRQDIPASIPFLS